MTHAELVQRGARWLWGTASCRPVLVEVNCWATSESPDAFGVNRKGTALVECKISMADFYADRGKPFRKNPNEGMGRLRYFMTPPGLIEPARFNLLRGWGLLEVGPKRVKVIKKSCRFNCSSTAEALLMRSAYMSGHYWTPTTTQIKRESL